MSALDRFHPAVSSWFRDVLGDPTPPQESAWPALLDGRDALVAAPTGSGKTLAGFLAALDGLARDAEEGTLTDEVRVVYVSPLKALSNDIQKNLTIPLDAIRARIPGSNAIRASVRTGDTPTKERAAALKKPPHLLVTTPESLFVLLTSSSGRKMLSTARTIILDEIHAVAGTRRGAHLALTVERLEHACGRKLQRIGLSATQKPVEEVARFLLGSGRVTTDGKPECVIVDEGHARKIDLAVEVPQSPLEAVMSNEVWSEVIARVADLVVEHKTTLVFVNTRRLAERVAARLEEALQERLGKGLVCAHHGSMSKERRLDAEQRLKEGKLRALVATASLELGIDVGAVDLVCQLGVTRSIAGLLQRVGRAGHHKSLIPKGRLFPLSRDELAEATALIGAITERDLDAIIIPRGGLDVLAQQIVAAAGDEDWNKSDLHALAMRAWPYRDLDEQGFANTLDLVANGVQTTKGRRGAHVFYDTTTGIIRGRKGAKLAALTSGGAIPDQGDYVVLEAATNAVVGTINEDFAIESMPGDVFQLGTASWRILKVERGVVRVQDAQGQPPSIPFWLGEAPARTAELSHHLTGLRELVEARASEGDGLLEVTQAIAQRYQLSEAAAYQLAEYLLATRAHLGALPTTKRVIFERFLDELGGSQIVVHAPFGGRVTRAWGLALRKRFCRTFDFELQAAATEDAVLLSVGAVNGVQLAQLPHFLTSKSVRHVLIQALLDAPMFGVRFRWNATRALTMLRMRGGRRIPPGLQRIEAEDLLVSLFPEQQACLENIVGDREIPDAVLIRQTIEDCLTEAMDIEGLEHVLGEMEQGRIEVRVVESAEPSPLAHEILSAKPYAFLDDTPLEERRVQAVFTRRALDSTAHAEGAALEARDIDEILAEIHPGCDNADEAHDTLLLHGFLREDELLMVGGAKMPALVDELSAAKRIQKAAAGKKPVTFAIERAPALRAIGIGLGDTEADRFASLVDILRARSEVTGPKSVARHAAELGLPIEEVARAIEELVKTGDLLAGHFDANEPDETVWSRRLVARARRRSLDRLRAQIEPVAPRDLMRYLLRRHGLEEPRRGIEALRRALERLDGQPAAAAAWEEEILPARVEDYDPQWLDQLCLAGHIEYARIEATRAVAPTSLRTTPLALVNRAHSALFERSAVDREALSADARSVLDVLERRGPSFYVDLLRETRLLPAQVEAALAELVAGGLITSDGYAGLRTLLRTAKDRDRVRRRARGRVGFGTGLDAAGRWALASLHDEEIDVEKRAEEQARVLLQRTGVVFRKLVEREPGLVPWRDLLWALRRLEARGEVRGGRFVAGFSGEQFALPDVVSELRAMRREELKQSRVVLSAVDPLNLTGSILPGARVPAVLGHRILLEDGLPIAVLDGNGVRMLVEGAVDAGEVDGLLRRRGRAARLWGRGAVV